MKKLNVGQIEDVINSTLYMLKCRYEEITGQGMDDNASIYLDQKIAKYIERTLGDLEDTIAA